MSSAAVQQLQQTQQPQQRKVTQIIKPKMGVYATSQHGKAVLFVGYNLFQ